ncbi:MAG: hypothetical protein ACJ77E_10840 [Gaiellaceae bacterium]
MLLFARALQGDESEVATAPRVRGESAPPLRPTWAPNPTFAPTATTTAAAPSSSEAARDALTRRLDEGRALREEFDPGASDARVGAWIHGVRHTIEQHKPGVVGYFNALGARGYANDGDRLDAHIGRLTTIVRDFLPASGNVIR